MSAVPDSWLETPKWLLPAPDADDREFWEGAGRGELRIQRCRSCGRHQHYARYLCSHCSSPELDWVSASGGGTIYSYTVIRQNGIPPFPDRVPFVVALVERDGPGGRVLAARPTAAPDDAAIGKRVQATFRDAGNGTGFVDLEL